MSAVPEDLLRRLDRAGPRYTSYPTADRFVEAFGGAQYAQALSQRVAGGALAGMAPLALYLHIPFCASVCYYCACNKVVTRSRAQVAQYLGALEREIELHVQAIGPGAPVAQVHLGGGTPTFLDDDELARLMTALRQAFRIGTKADLSIEVDPRTVTPRRLERLREMGFNRLSFGVQDLDAQVQLAVHRVQPEAPLRDLINAARSLNFHSINVDLIYGLPRQTPESFASTVQRIGAWRPDRLSVYAYAHLPERFKPQRRIANAELPTASHRMVMLATAIDDLVGRGYEYIGMDHFALPGDALAVAKRQGRLHRNFQGYSTAADGDLIGLGVSAIGRIGACYSQNAKELPEYLDAMRQRRFATGRGLSLTRDDLVRRSVIMAVMCQGRVAFESIELAHLIRMREYFAAELAQLEPLASSGLVRIESDAIELTPLGWYFVRAVAMVFDRHLDADRARERFSRVI